MSMNAKTITLLEFDKIFDLLREECLTAEGKDLLEKQDFFVDSEKLALFQNTVGEIKRYLHSEYVFPNLYFPPIGKSIEKAGKEGAVLEGTELAGIAAFCLSSSRLKNYFLENKLPETDGVLSFVSDMVDASDIAAQITATLDASGKVRENHPLLKKMRETLRAMNSRMSELTSRYMTENRDVWQTDVPAVRDGRTVLPLKANYRGRVKGIIHAVSAKGATVFIEPFDILELNNRITLHENEILVVMRKILKDLTTVVSRYRNILVLLVDQIAYLDTLIARARFSIRFNGHRAEAGGPLVLFQARHPLLGDKAVPINIAIKDELHVLILTGPNAGGKTVTLKTVGLFALMNQFGMDIPAAEGSCLGVFDGIFADIGDDQSLEKSLSTFSAHMENVSYIVKHATERSLVLLDEIGSGTDPAEGIAIAMAVLDTLLARQSIVLTTSHHGLLKNYGYVHKHVSNASMEFDSFSHTPTYRILSGVPGESHAIEIAKRSGVPEEIIEQSRAYLRSDQSDVSAMIQELERKQRELHEQEKYLKEEKRKADRKALELKQKESLLKKKETGELRKFMTESRRSLENLVKELREGEVTREKTTKVKQFIAQLEEKVLEEEENISSLSEEESNVPVSGLKEGMSVEVGTFRRPGTLIRKERNGNWIVAVGAVKMSFPLSQIYSARKDHTGRTSYSISISGVLSENHPAFTLDIRGLRGEEAAAKVTKQLDNAIMKGMREFVIIHGKGEGALQAVVSHILQSSNGVLDYSFAPPEEGGTGKTIVRLRE